MVSSEMLEEVKARLIVAYAPKSIILFGSYAWGEPGPDSDIDLLIVVESSEEKMPHRSLAGRRVLRGLKLAKDILVYTAKEFNTLASDPSTLVSKINQQGKRLYGKL